MKKQSLFSLFILFIGLNTTYSQSEIDLIADRTAIGVTPYILNVKTIDNNKLLVKYVCLAPCIVKSKMETTMKGFALRDGNKISAVGLSDVVMVLVEQEVDITAKTTSVTNRSFIALRGVDENLTYTVSLEGVENGPRWVTQGTVVPYSKLSISKIPNIAREEVIAIESLFDVFDGNSSGRSVDLFAPEVVVKKVGSNQKALRDFLNGNGYKFEGFSFPPDENTIKYNKLDDGVEYLLTRDRRIKKDVGVAYKSYFVYNKRDVVKIDSAFYADRSDTERPEEVFNIDKNKYTGVLARWSCEPLNKDIKLNYFRYTYFDTDKNVRKFRFQTENGKMNSFAPERTFKMGDTIIHLTKKKGGGYQSSVFVNDTVKLKYPINDKDTLKFRSVYCGNSPAAGNNFFGSADQIFMNFKFRDFTILTEQSILTKMFAGLVPMNHPEADVKGYALTKVYVISNNSVKSINRIMVPYFSDKTAAYNFIYSDEKKVVYMVNMAYPVFFIFDDKGNINLKEANSGTFLPQIDLVSNKHTIMVNGSNYLLYRDAATGKTKLVSVTF
jgi:hypothetical protein